MSGPVAAVVALTVAALLVAVIEICTRRVDRRHRRRIAANSRIIREIQNRELSER